MMKTSITKRDAARLEILKTRADRLWEELDGLVDGAKELLGEDDELGDNSMAADLMLNSTDKTAAQWLAAWGPAIEGK